MPASSTQDATGYRDPVDLIEGPALLDPDAVAIESADGCLTHGELRDRSWWLAANLGAVGVGPGQRVVVFMPRCCDLMVALLAVMRSGAAYVPLDPTQPEERLRLLIEDAAPTLVLTSSSTRQKAVAVGISSDLIVDARDFARSTPLSLPPAPVAQPTDAAYVIYTSGTTGRPKGVIISRSALSNLLLAGVPWPDLGRDDAVLATATVSFDMAVPELYCAVAAGGRVVLASDSEARDPSAIAALTRAHRVTALQATPSMWRLVTDLDAEAFRGLKLGVGADTVPPDLARRLRELSGTVTHLYGPTETTVWSLTGPLEDNGKPPALGQPIRRTTATVLDACLRPVSPGGSGELYLGGDGIARGYHECPVLTASRFIATAGGQRFYRTGDLVRVREDGEFLFLGRVDHQVKIRGYRVETGDVEAVLRQAPDVREAVVGVHDIAGEPALVAYLVPQDPSEDEDGATLVLMARKHAEARLPSYLVPTAWIRLPSLPLTINGKINRAALPPPNLSGGCGGRGTTSTEKILVDLFAKVLELPEAGVDDNFTDLGGNSLLAARLVTAIRDRCNRSVSVRDIYAAPTPHNLASVVDRAKHAADPITTCSDLLGRPSQLSPSQRSMWVLHRLNPQDTAYHMAYKIPLHGRLDINAMRAGLAAVCRRHDILRTVYREIENVPYAIVRDDTPSLRVVDADDGIDEHLVAEPFDLEVDLPIRVTYVHGGDDPDSSSSLYLVLHHIAADGWSLRPFLRDLSRAYNAHLEGTTPNWGVMPVRYADYALWSLTHSDPALDTTARNDLDYWLDVLDGSPSELPFYSQHGTTDRQRGNRHCSTLASDLVNKAQALSRSEGVSLFTVLDCALAALYQRLGAGDDVVIGAPSAGRHDARLDDVVGYFVNPVALRHNLRGKPSFQDLLHHTSDVILNALDHDRVPFDRVVDALAKRTGNRAEPFRTMVVLQPADELLLHLSGVRCEPPITLPTGSARFDLSWEFSERSDGGLDVGVEYRSDLFDAKGVEEIVGYYERLLTQLVATPQRSPRDVDLRSDWQISDAGSPWDGPTAQPSTFTALFDSMVAAQPYAPAVEHDSRVLTYDALDRQSSALATLLVRHGVRRGDIVGVAVPRSVDQIVCTLAVFKAAAAYLPIDMSYPQDRINHVVRDSRPRLVLSTAAALMERTITAPVMRIDDSSFRAEVDALIATGDNALPWTLLTPDDLAYVIYTSGSTGRPKGVEISHRGVANLALTQQVSLCCGPGARVLQFAPLSFDASYWELSLALLTGATLVLGDPEQLVPGPDLAAFVTQSQITHATLPPAALSVTDDQGLFQGGTLVTAGEACSGGLRARWAGGRRFVNAYGPTETTVCASLTDALTSEEHEPSIGRSVAGAQCMVLDEQLFPAPAGVVGDLYVSGDGLARGYLGLPTLTANRFVACPWGPAGSRAYRTGDRARVDRDGNLHFHGRSDHQVKIRAHRIEPGEVEAELTALGAEQAVVVARRDVPGGPKLVGYAVFPDADAAAVKAELAARLPHYLVPSWIVLLDRLPTTPNGKVNRAQLPTPVTPTETTQSPHAADATGTDSADALREVFREVLGVDARLDDNFFDLGGDSIMAIQLVGKARGRGLQFRAKDVFELGTPRALARVATSTSKQICGPSEADSGVVLPLPMHRWLQGIEGETTGFSQVGVLPLPAGITDDAVTQTVQKLLDRHGALRAHVIDAPTGEEVLEVRLPGSVSAATVLTLVHEPNACVADIVESMRRNLDPRRIPVRFVAWRDRLFVVAHHLFIDAVSWQILYRDLETIRTSGTVPPATGDLRTYAAALHAAIPAARKQLSYWRDVVRRGLLADEGLPNTLTVLDTYGAAASFTWRLDERQLQKLLSVADAYHTRIDVILLAGLAAARVDWSARHYKKHSTSCFVSVESHGRILPNTDLDLSEVVGWLTRMYPVLLKLDDAHVVGVHQSDGVEGLVKHVKEQLRTVPDDGFYYPLLRHLDPDAPLSDNTPLLLFNYLGHIDRPVHHDGSPLSFDLDVMKAGDEPKMSLTHPIEFNCFTEEDSDGAPTFVVHCRWAPRLLADAEVHDLVMTWRSALETMTQHTPASSGFTPSDLSLLSLSQDEIDLIESAWKASR